MNQLELDAIRDRLTRVTPGPWGTIPPGGLNGPFFWNLQSHGQHRSDAAD